ncbi:site-specific tyrosine recombinase XerC [Pseudobythopirellula maris]|uniref:Site-specific tyrosine recombinase XerC n=1 Tax=Pseudobythopirellula maris TaxID=2527991 RepID=A0A5C5ZHP2_9BACT|nr:site-specific tyrosine recombinase XerC [Pseudobythopirellula maris]
MVCLPPEALEVIKRLAEKWPEGPLFRNPRGIPWSRISVRLCFRRLKEKLGMPKLCATTLRHSFAHHRLTSGQDALTVAKLMGHVDTRMLATRYVHLDANPEFMQNAANQTSFPALPVELPSSSPDQPA